MGLYDQHILKDYHIQIAVACRIHSQVVLETIYCIDSTDSYTRVRVLIHAVYPVDVDLVWCALGRIDHLLSWGILACCTYALVY